MAESLPRRFLDKLYDENDMNKELKEKIFFGRDDLMRTHKSLLLTEDAYEEFLLNYLGSQVWRPRGKRDYNFVIYGCSGYTGKITLEYALNSVGNGVSFALAGRNAEKVKKAKAEVMEARQGVENDHDPPVMEVSLSDARAIRQVCLSADVIINIAGPFMKTGGDLLVEGCLHYGTDYVDVNGEIPFTHKLAVNYHRTAKKVGTIILPNSAFAGAAVDIAVREACRIARERHNEQVRACRVYTAANQATAPSGGTMATRQAMNASLREVASLMTDPFSLGGKIGDGKRPEDQDKELQATREDTEMGAWIAPNQYAFYETRIVRRSNRLLYELGSRGYGTEFNFLEHSLVHDKDTAEKLKRIMTNTAQEEEELKKAGKLYNQGEGAPKEIRRSAKTRYFVHALTNSGKSVNVQLDAGDAYDETGHMVVEVALCLALRRDGLPFCGGVLTPSVACGDSLVTRLNQTGLLIREVDSFDTSILAESQPSLGASDEGHG